MTLSLSCPLCGRDDAVRCKDQPRFYEGGRLRAICFHGHDGRGPAWFDAETGELVRQIPLQPFELLYRAASEGEVRGFGEQFLAEHCGIYILSRQDIQAAQPPFPTEKDWLKAEQQDAAIAAVPLYRGAPMVGLELRMLERRSIGKVTRWVKTLGEGGVYIANPRLQPQAVILLEGIWDAVSAAWDALEHDEPSRYAFTSVSASTSAEVVEEVLKAHFPGVPVVILTDQDGPGKRARQKFARLGTLAIMPGAGLAKDYREANPAIRWEALLAAADRALTEEPAGEEHGLAKIARRALEGALRGKRLGLRDLEAWRFGQRCAGICLTRSGKRYFAIRARVNGQMPVAEGQHEFTAILSHRLVRTVREEYPDLAAVVEGGPTETHVSTAWLPPQFVSDGRHWTEIPVAERKEFARVRAWEPWTGRDPGRPQPEDLEHLMDQVRNAYLYARIPGVPDSEAWERVAVFCLSTTLSALWAEERWQAGAPLGFLPCTWFYGGAATGKGTASKLVALTCAGEMRTFGSQRFDGADSGTWLTESVLHLPVCFRDELDQFLPAHALEDLKAYLAGEPLQLRKKFGSDMTIAPKPVVFSSNALKINEDDEATRDRINLVQIEANPISSKVDRNRAFDSFYRWVEGGGREVCQRTGILLYRDFRGLTFGPAKWTRSVVFDAAMAFVCSRVGINPEIVMAAAAAGKETAIRQSLPWYAAIQEYAHHELGGGGHYHEAPAAQVWSISTGDETQVRKLRRWLDQMESATKNAPLSVCGWMVTLGDRAPSTSRKIIFRNPNDSTPDGEPVEILV